MELALEEAHAAAARGEVPVGAVVTDAAGAVLARAGNEVEARRDPSAHAELLALRAAAAALGDKVLPEATLWVTLEPCALCAAAASFFRVKRVVFGAYDPKGGAVEHGPRFFAQPTCLHVPEVVGGVREAEAAAVLRGFFAGLRGSADMGKPPPRPSPAQAREREKKALPRSWAGEGWVGASQDREPTAPNKPRREMARDLRRNPTPQEATLWRHLRGSALGARFRRQHPIPPYVADFACIEAKIVIELDGGQHGPPRDAARDAAMAAAGWQMLRYWNNDDLDGILQDIATKLRERLR